MYWPSRKSSILVDCGNRSLCLRIQHGLELVDRLLRSFFKVEVEKGGFGVVVMGVESAFESFFFFG